MTDDNTSERWRRTKQLFNSARAKPTFQQGEFLRSAAADDEDLFREVQLLLRAAENTERSFEDVVAEAARQVGHSYELSQSRRGKDSLAILSHPRITADQCQGTRAAVKRRN